MSVITKFLLAITAAIAVYACFIRSEHLVVEAATRETSADESVTASPQKRDPVSPPEIVRGYENLVHDLLQGVLFGEYEYQTEVATGRFLESFEEGLGILAETDLESLRVFRRQRTWVRLVANPTDPERADREIWIRVVETRDGWKVEDARCLPRARE